MKRRSRIQHLDFFIFIVFIFLTGCARLPLNETLETNASQTIWVSTTGSNNGSCGTASTPCGSIAYAVNRVNALGSSAPGSTVIVKNGTYYEKSSIVLGVSGTGTQPITLKAENVVTSLNTPKNVTIYYDGPSINRWGEGAIKGKNISHWVVEGFKIQSVIDTLLVNYNGKSYSRPIPRIFAGLLFFNSDNMIVRYNHTYQTGISGITFRPDLALCSSVGYDGDKACAIQNVNNKVIGNRIELPNQGWRESNGAFNLEQEALTMWGVDGFEIANNLILDGTKEGIDIKLGRNGNIHHNHVTGLGRGIAAMGISENGVAIYLDGRKEKMYNINIYNNVVRYNKRIGIFVTTERPQSSPVNTISNIKIYNNIVHSNGSAGLALGDCVGSSNNSFDVDIYHNTFVENRLPFIIKSYSSAYAVRPHHITLWNNIFSNSGSGGPGTILNAHDVRVVNNLFTWTNDPTAFYATNSFGITNNNIINASTRITSQNRNDPGFNPTKFMSLASSNYSLALRGNSPAVSVGSTFVGAATKDFVDMSRDAKPDIGAYEYR